MIYKSNKCAGDLRDNNHNIQRIFEIHVLVQRLSSCVSLVLRTVSSCWSTYRWDSILVWTALSCWPNVAIVEFAIWIWTGVDIYSCAWSLHVYKLHHSQALFLAAAALVLWQQQASSTWGQQWANFIILRTHCVWFTWYYLTDLLAMQMGGGLMF